MNRARAFAKRVAKLPGFPHLWIGSGALAALMTVTGGFHTGELPPGLRALFWALLFGWSAIKWQTWFALTVRKPRDWIGAGLIGALLLNLLLPVEIAAVLHVLGVRHMPGLWETWARAFALSLVAAASIVAFKVWHRGQRAAAGSTMAPHGQVSKLLLRAGVRAENLLSVKAEDHYCRVHRLDGSSALVHYRFGDALRELAGFDGAQVNRGAWVAASGIRGSARVGRSWRLQLADGGTLSVSATHLPQIRARGWLSPNFPPPAVG